MKLVTIVSDQTIQNILFIRQHMAEASQVVLITTDEMERKGKTDAIRKTCGLDNKNVKKMIANPHNLSEAKNRIQMWLGTLKSDESFLVNITGGTKLLSMAVFSSFPPERTAFVYLPLGQQQYQQFDQSFQTNTHSINVQLSLDDYFSACGLLYNSDTDHPLFDYEDVMDIFAQYKTQNFVLRNFPLQWAKKKCRFQVEDDNLPGYWFEDYIYHQLKRELGLAEEQIGRSVKIYFETEQPSSDQEVDFMFVRNNELHMLECKVSTTGLPQITADLSKMHMLAKTFGLSSRAYFVTLKNLKTINNDFSRSLYNKLKLYETTNLADQNDLKDINFNWDNFFNTKRIV